MARRISTYDYRVEGSSYDPNAVPMNEAEGIQWSDATTRDLKAAIADDDSLKEIALFLQYSEPTVRAKAKELGLSIPPGGKPRVKRPKKERHSHKTDDVEAEPIASPDLFEIAAPIGEKPQATRELIEATIVELCRGRFLTVRQLANLLGRNEQRLRNDYINGMVSDGRLRLKFPHTLKSPHQRYGA